MRDRITKLNKTSVRLSNGTEFTIVHELPMEGVVGSFEAAFDNWISRTKHYTDDSFCAYVKSKSPNTIFVTLDQFEKLTKGRSTPATEQEFLAENQ